VAARDAVVDRAVSGGHHWPTTPGIAVLADLNGYIRLNLRGRERLGMLDPAGAAQGLYEDRVHAAFSTLRTPDGTPLVDAVRFARDELPGARSHRLPDLIVTWSGAPPASAAVADGHGTVTGAIATGRTGNHRPDGFCVVLGPPGGPRSDAQPGHVADLAPLVTRLLLHGDAR
jgi:predicted AlkP superfamily phosphohydrolase/phosphomutase